MSGEEIFGEVPETEIAPSQVYANVDYARLK